MKKNILGLDENFKAKLIVTKLKYQKKRSVKETSPPLSQESSKQKKTKSSNEPIYSPQTPKRQARSKIKATEKINAVNNLSSIDLTDDETVIVTPQYEIKPRPLQDITNVIAKSPNEILPHQNNSVVSSNMSKSFSSAGLNFYNTNNHILKWFVQQEVDRARVEVDRLRDREDEAKNSKIIRLETEVNMLATNSRIEFFLVLFSIITHIVSS
jgi:hypothetical protein